MNPLERLEMKTHSVPIGECVEIMELTENKQYLFDVTVEGTVYRGYSLHTHVIEKDPTPFAIKNAYTVVVPNQDIATVVEAVERLVDEDHGRDTTMDHKYIRKDYAITSIVYRESVRL